MKGKRNDTETQRKMKGELEGERYGWIDRETERGRGNEIDRDRQRYRIMVKLSV